MQHRGFCSAAPGCSLLDHASVASFVSFGDREIFHIYFWLGLQLSLQTYHHPSPFSHAYTTVACLKAVLYCFIFSKAAIWRICIADAVEQMIFAFFAGAVWPRYLLTLWWRKLVHYLTCSWWLIAVQEVWQSHLTLYCSFAEHPSCSRRENWPVSSRHKLWGLGYWADTLRPFGIENLLAHCSLACWQHLWSIVRDISRGLPRYIACNIFDQQKCRRCCTSSYCQLKK